MIYITTDIEFIIKSAPSAIYFPGMSYPGESSLGHEPCIVLCFGSLQKKGANFSL